jgi:hypothetical protein
MAQSSKTLTQTPRNLIWIAAMSLILFLLALLMACFRHPTPITAGSLADIDHVVLFMQENRAFDHVILPFHMDYQTLIHIFSTLERWQAFEDFQILTSR